MVSVRRLTEADRRTLKRLARRERGRTSERLHMVLLADRGYSVPQIAEIFDYSEATVSRWLARFEKDRAAGVLAAAQVPRRRDEAEAAGRHSTFLAEASAALASSLDYDATLQQVARVATRGLADWCTVYVRAESGEIRRAATAYADPAQGELAAALHRYPPSPVAPSSSVAEAMRSGQARVIPEIPQEYVETIAQDAEHLEIMRKLAFRSSLVVPLRARGGVIGALALFRGEASPRYGDSDLPLAQDLARRAALAVDNARLYREAQRAIQVRNEFLSVAAHELKSPVSTLVVFAQVLLRQFEKAGPDQRVARRALQAFERQSLRLGRLVTRLLDVSRIEAGGLGLDCEVTNLAALVQQVAAAAQVTSGRHTVVAQSPPEVWAVVDPLRLEQVVTNLIDNAVKYSPNGGQIDIELTEPAPDVVRLAVRDRGIGIPLEKRRHIFDRLYRAHADGHASGMGLGLYISRQIVELHGGSIRVESPPGGGSRFVVDLPRGDADDAEWAEAAIIGRSGDGSALVIPGADDPLGKRDQPEQDDPQQR